MGAVIVFFSPELILLLLGALTLLAFLLWHIRTFTRSVIAIAASMFAWAMEAGFIGFVAYIAAWVFMFPVMSAICIVGGIVLTWIESRAAKEARREARRHAASTTLS